jgi:glycerate 2-kinase
VPYRLLKRGHPVPDEAGLLATRRIMDLAQSAGADDLVIVLMSGGASSLMVSPIEGVSIDLKRDINRQLLASGAPITEMNIVRKALSAIKGGKLARIAAPARVVSYIISDVPGDDPSVVGSGPSIFAATPKLSAVGILDRYGLTVPEKVRSLLGNSCVSADVETKNEVHVIGSARQALVAAADKARELGIEPMILGDALEGEAREVGVVLAGISKSTIAYGDPLRRPCVILSGGETTVTKKGPGRGGRNSEFLLSLSIAMGDIPCAAIAADTDGIDGSEDNAGAWFDERMACQNDVELRRNYLNSNDSYSYFAASDRLVVAGPTRTNVNDFRAILIR